MRSPGTAGASSAAPPSLAADPDDGHTVRRREIVFVFDPEVYRETPEMRVGLAVKPVNTNAGACCQAVVRSLTGLLIQRKTAGAAGKPRAGANAPGTPGNVPTHRRTERP